jgi:peptidoglycan/xylan/chitin deacetylase (PgdA/CDA1 family)
MTTINGVEKVMRQALALALAISVSAAATAWAQNAQAPAPAPAAAQAKCDNPNALGVSRVVQIDTTGGPGFGFEHFKAYDFLRDHEIVLTFDDGPWPGNTPAVLKALAEQCTKALFFPIGKHAGWHPEILKQVEAAGHTIGSHTWSHKDLTRLTPDEAKAEIEKGLAAVSIALGNKPVGSFFRFPALRNPPDMVKYLGDRNIGIFSTDMDSFDFKMRKPEQVIKSVMSKLAKHGKGIILMHDFQHATAEAAPELFKQLKAGGFKVVQVVGKTPVEPIKEYTDVVLKEMGGGLDEARPMTSVIQTIQGN